MFARRTFADAEGGRQDARRGQTRPGRPSGKLSGTSLPDKDEPESLALLHHPGWW
jgi:hypothetical protein